MTESLLILVYILLIVLLIIAIILGIKLIFTLNKVDELVDDVTEKVRSLDKVFQIVDTVSDKVNGFLESIIGFATNGIKKVFKKKNKKIEGEDEENE